jgi:hypothetical protein
MRLEQLHELHQRQFLREHAYNVHVVDIPANLDWLTTKILTYSTKVLVQSYFNHFINHRYTVLRAEYQVDVILNK